MNRHSMVFTAPSGSATSQTVLMGPFALTTHLVEKHKYSIMVHNFGNVNLVFTPQYFYHAAWRTCQNIGATSPAGPYTVVARAEMAVEFMFEKGTMFRIRGYGVSGTTDGRIEMLEVDFESNLNDR